jgi:hypothetical protein
MRHVTIWIVGDRVYARQGEAVAAARLIARMDGSPVEVTEATAEIVETRREVISPSRFHEEQLLSVPHK